MTKRELIGGRLRYQRRNVRQIVVDGDVALVPLSNGMHAIIDACDVAKVSAWNWQANTTTPGKYYARRSMRLNGVHARVYMHNIISPPLPGLVSHHRDGDGLNNRSENLVSVTDSENFRYAALKKRQVGGVHFNKYLGKWVARLTLGYFENKEDATRMLVSEARKRKKAADAHSGSQRPAFVIDVEGRELEADSLQS